MRSSYALGIFLSGYGAARLIDTLSGRRVFPNYPVWVWALIIGAFVLIAIVAFRDGGKDA